MLQKGSLAVGDSRAYGILSPRKCLWYKYSSLKDVCTEKKGSHVLQNMKKIIYLALMDLTLLTDLSSRYRCSNYVF